MSLGIPVPKTFGAVLPRGGVCAPCWGFRLCLHAPPLAAPCALHVLVALDVTDFQQSNLQPYLERILRDLAALESLTCRPLSLHLSLQSVGQGGDTIFQGGLREPWADVLRRLARAHAFQRSYFNQLTLQSFLGTLARQEEDTKVREPAARREDPLLAQFAAGAPAFPLGQALLVLTDGLDDEVQRMKEVATAAWLQGWGREGLEGTWGRPPVWRATPGHLVPPQTRPTCC